MPHPLLASSWAHGALALPDGGGVSSEENQGTKSFPAKVFPDLWGQYYHCARKRAQWPGLQMGTVHSHSLAFENRNKP